MDTICPGKALSSPACSPAHSEAVSRYCTIGLSSRYTTAKGGPSWPAYMSEAISTSGRPARRSRVPFARSTRYSCAGSSRSTIMAQAVLSSGAT